MKDFVLSLLSRGCGQMVQVEEGSFGGRIEICLEPEVMPTPCLSIMYMARCCNYLYSAVWKTENLQTPNSHTALGGSFSLLQGQWKPCFFSIRTISTGNPNKPCFACPTAVMFGQEGIPHHPEPTAPGGGPLSYTLRTSHCRLCHLMMSALRCQSLGPPSMEQRVWSLLSGTLQAL